MLDSEDKLDFKDIMFCLKYLLSKILFTIASFIVTGLVFVTAIAGLILILKAIHAKEILIWLLQGL